MAHDTPRLTKGSAIPSLDLRGLALAVARGRAFQGVFRVKPGQRLTILTDSAPVEQALMQWIQEIGHRFLRVTSVEEGGRPGRAIELIKQEARR